MQKIAVRSTAGIVLLITAAFAVAGCGGGSKSSAPQPVTVTVAPTTPATTTTEAPATTTTEAPTSGLSVDCLGLAKQGAKLSQAMSGLSATGGSPDIVKITDAYKAFADQAPAEIRPAFQTLAAAFVKLAAARNGLHFKAGQIPDAASMQKLQELAKSFSAPDIVAAEQKISAWSATHCHA